MQLRTLFGAYFAGWSAAVAQALPPPSAVPPMIDAGYLRALVPTAVAGMLGGLAVAVWRPSSSPWETARVTFLGLLVGGFCGAAMLDWPFDWPHFQTWGWGGRIVLTFFVGIGAKSLVGAALKIFDSIEANPFEYLKRALKEWASKP